MTKNKKQKKSDVVVVVVVIIGAEAREKTARKIPTHNIARSFHVAYALLVRSSDEGILPFCDKNILKTLHTIVNNT